MPSCRQRNSCGSSKSKDPCQLKAQAEVDTLLEGKPPQWQLETLHKMAGDHSNRLLNYREENAQGRIDVALLPWNSAQEPMSDAIRWHKAGVVEEAAKLCRAKSAQR